MDDAETQRGWPVKTAAEGLQELTFGLNKVEANDLYAKLFGSSWLLAIFGNEYCLRLHILQEEVIVFLLGPTRELLVLWPYARILPALHPNRLTSGLLGVWGHTMPSAKSMPKKQSMNAI